MDKIKKDKAVVITAIIVIGCITGGALALGHNSTTLTLALLLICGLAGWKLLRPE